MSEPGPDGILTSLLLAFRDFAQPVTDAFASPEAMEYFWYQFGWRVTLDEVALAAIKSVLPVSASLQQLETAADAVRNAIESGRVPSASDLASLAEVVTGLGRGLGTFSPSSPAGLPAPLDDLANWAALAEQMLDSLLERYLRAHRPAIYLFLLTTGVITYAQLPADLPVRVACTQAAFDWDQLQALLHDPVTALARAYHWNDPAAPFDHERLLDSLTRVLAAIGLGVDAVAPALQLDPGLPANVAAEIRGDTDALRVTLVRGVALSDQSSYEVGFDLLPAAGAGSAVPNGLVLRPRLIATGTEAIPLGQSFKLTFSVAADVGAVLGVSFFPSGAALTGGDATIGTSVAVTTASSAPFYLAGTSTSARIELHSPTFTASFEQSGGAELRIELAAPRGGSDPGAKVVVPLGSADAFVQDCASSGDLSFSFSPGLSWSSTSGFAFNGSPTPQVSLPTSVKIGTFTLQNAKIAIVDGPSATSHPSFALQVAVDIAGRIGPVALAVTGVGFAVNVVPYSHADLAALPPGAPRPALGSIDVALAFVPPAGAGLSVDAGVVTGGGFLEHTGDEYAGALDLVLQGTPVKAYGLLQTKLPGGQPGYSFIAVISAEFVPPVTLPFGFLLEAVGGLIGINRTISPSAVETALWAHHLDGLLFPHDPVASAPQLLTALDTYFPAAPGRYMVGPMVKIGWSANLVVGEVAVLLELPEPLQVLLIGDIQVTAPVVAPQLVLHISFAGGIDFGAKLAFFDATLHDSKLAGFPISGDLAFRYGWGDDAVFALAIGGFNPQFQPPAAFPPLKRLAISINSSVAKLEAQGYLALTPNTLQFGARAELTAGTGGFNVHGWLGFDALLEKDPLSFEFDLSAGVDLRSGTDVLASVHLDGKLSGPTPWHISGKASLSLLFFDVSVHFDKTWGGSAGPVSVPDPLAALVAALADRSGWSAQAAPGVRAAITPVAAPADAGAAVLLDPAGALRIAQRAVPLDHPVTRFGGVSLGRTVSFSVDSLTAFGQPAAASGTATEEFAAAQFLDFTDAEKLSLPSFSRFDAGVDIGASAVDLGHSARPRSVLTPVAYDTTVIDTRPPPPPDPSYRPGLAAVLALNGTVDRLAPGLGRYAPAPGTPPRVTLAADQWVVASTTDLGRRADIASDGTKLGAHLALQRYLSANPGDAGGLQIVMANEAG
jgi:hypothetical protein